MTHVQEETYLITEAEHTKGTNRYTFTFSPHWRSVFNKALSMSVRTVKLWRSNRIIYLNGLSINTSTESWNISPSVVMNSTWEDLNDKLSMNRKMLYELYSATSSSHEFSESSYAIVSSKDSLIITVNTTKDCYLTIDESDNIASSDLMVLTGLTDQAFWIALAKHSNKIITKEQFAFWARLVELRYDSNDRIRMIKFNKLASREDLIVKASFVDLAFHQYLGLTNETFIPPKVYDVCYGDQKFYIDLESIDGQPVELPSDDKDMLVLECMMNLS